MDGFHRTSQWPPLAGPMRRRRPCSYNFLMFRSMDRSVTPINEARSGMVNSSSCFNAAKIFPDVFPKLTGRTSIFPEFFTELFTELFTAFR